MAGMARCFSEQIRNLRGAEIAMTFHRYAIYFTAPSGPLAKFGAAWLGWDVATGQDVEHPDLEALPKPASQLTATPQKYGFHGTLKPPFQLAENTNANMLAAATADLATALAPVTLEGLTVSCLGSFLALTPLGDTAALSELAASVVSTLDPFRRPPSEGELARRRRRRLSPRQDQNLMQWGYPYVMDDFRFHLTLTDCLKRDELSQTQIALNAALADLLPAPFIIGDLTLVGEDNNGRFHQICRFALQG